jgi:hypothetical protein
VNLITYFHANLKYTVHGLNTHKHLNTHADKTPVF